MVVPAAEECDAEVPLAHGKAVWVNTPQDERAVRSGPVAFRPEVRDDVEERQSRVAMLELTHLAPQRI